MDFKIDTKDTFTVISPIYATINAKLADELQNTCDQTRQNGSNNFIIDLSQVTSAEKDGIDGLIALHEHCYSNNESLVFTGTSPDLVKILKDEEADTLLNIAPKMIEAVDIISMEILERDLLGEE
jgi:anti-anti-sigma regulatory factor